MSAAPRIAHDTIEAITRTTILVIDDDAEMTEMLAEYLEPEGFAIEVAHDGESGLRKALQQPWALVVLDVMLPRMNGFEVLRRLRPASTVPVLMLTARGDSVDRVTGLQTGADDYLPKPFDPQELVARVKAILRRTALGLQQSAEMSEAIRVGDVVLNSSARTVRRGAGAVELTAAEFDLLRSLLRSAGRIVTREALFRDVLGRDFTVFDRAIDNHISSLRRKLGTHGDGQDRIRAIRNAGYIYTVAEPAEPRS